MAGPLVLVTLRKMLLSSELLKVLCHLELCEGRNILTTLLGLPTYAAPLAKRGDLTTAILQSAMSSYAQEIEADAKERARFITSAMQKQMLASFVSRMESLLEVVATLEIEPGFQMDAQLMPILLQLQPKFQAPGQRFQGGGAAGAAGQGGGAAGAAGQGGGAAGGASSNAGGTKRGKDDAASGNSPAGGKKPASRSGARKPPSAPPPPRDRRTLQQMMSDAALASDGGGAGASHTDGLEGVASPLSPPLFTPLGVQQQLSDPTRLRSLEEAVDRLTAEVRRVGEPNLVATHPKWRLS